VEVMVRPVKGSYFIKWLHSGLFEAAADLESYSCENFLSRRDIRDLMYDSKIGGFVVVKLLEPVAYVIYECSDLKLEILNLVVHEDHRRQGVGSLLLDKMHTRTNWQEMTACVRESNLSAQLFLRAHGFLATGIEKSYFNDQYPDCIEHEDGFRFLLKR
jgi:ribosomal protein S18 acetylase RimI-like enzyme